MRIIDLTKYYTIVKMTTSKYILEKYVFHNISDNVFHFREPFSI